MHPLFEATGKLVIDGFWDAEVARTIAADFETHAGSSSPEKWHVYNNPLEKKLARDDLEGCDTVQRAVEYLESPAFLHIVRGLTGMEDLQVDPHRHGGGMHRHVRGGKLDLHVDYSLHPLSGLTRALNLVCYLTPDWDPAWGGDLVLGDSTIVPKFNRAVLFRTDGPREAVHGMPFPLRCPETVARHSIAVYYVRQAPPEHGHIRHKAAFFPMPGAQERIAAEFPRYGSLYALRSTRRLEPSDLWDSWETDPLGRGLWY